MYRVIGERWHCDCDVVVDILRIELDRESCLRSYHLDGASSFVRPYFLSWLEILFVATMFLVPLTIDGVPGRGFDSKINSPVQKVSPDGSIASYPNRIFDVEQDPSAMATMLATNRREGSSQTLVCSFLIRCGCSNPIMVTIQNRVLFL